MFLAGGVGRILIAIVILVALAALSGLVLGRSHFPLYALLSTGTVLALLSAFALQNQSFGAFPEILVIVACLTINQAVYVIGGLSTGSGPGDPPEHGSPHIQADDIPGDGRQSDVHAESERQQNSKYCASPQKATR
jgi:hypothetical protein